MKAMMMVESGMDRHIATSPPSNGIATEHLTSATTPTPTARPRPITAAPCS